MRHAIDTSALIDLWHLYPPDVFEGLWEILEAMVDSGEMFSPEEVLHELGKRDDALHRWAKDRPAAFLPLTPNVQRRVQEVLSVFPNMVNVDDTGEDADPFVVALALAESCQEIIRSENPRRSLLRRPRSPMFASIMVSDV